MLKLERRTVLLGDSIKGQSKVQGDTRVARLGFFLKNVPVTELELSGILLNEHAAKRLFVKRKGKPAEPIFSKVASTIPLDHKITGVSLRVFLGGRRTMALQDATLHHFLLEVRQGLIQCHMAVHCTPELDGKDSLLEALLTRCGDKVDVEIECQGYGAQQELPIDGEDEDADQADVEDEDEEKDPEPAGGVPPKAKTARRGRNEA